MKDAQKPDHISLSTLIGRLKDGRFVIPDFQREFEWEPWDIRDLMRSIFLDYYIGSLLLWKGKPENFDALACEPIYGFNGNGSARAHRPRRSAAADRHVLRVRRPGYTGPEPRQPIPLLHPCGAVYGDGVRRRLRYDWTRGGLKLLGNTTQQYEDHMFPLSVIGRGGWALPNWVQGYEAYWRDKAATAQESGDVSGAESCAPLR